MTKEISESILAPYFSPSLNDSHRLFGYFSLLGESVLAIMIIMLGNTTTLFGRGTPVDMAEKCMYILSSQMLLRRNSVALISLEID